MSLADPTQVDLDELYKLVAGLESYGWLGPGLHTWPSDPEKVALHEGCLTLEREGKIVRIIDSPEHVYWKPRPAERPAEGGTTSPMMALAEDQGIR